MYNKVYNEDCLDTMKRIKDKSVNLIIADFPYFEVKGEFDFIWKSFDEFLEWVEVCAKEFKRILADNGSLYVYGHAKKIAYKQIIFDKYFNIENHIVWEKLQCQTKIGLDEFNSYAPIKEHILFYSNGANLQTVEKEYVAQKNPFAIELKRARLEKGISINQVAEYGKFYGNVNHGGAVTNWERGYNVPQLEQWEILCDNLPIKTKNYNILRKEYENIRKEYSEKIRPFNNKYRLEDVMKFYQEANITGKYNHPTQKPPKLSRALIETSTRKGDLVYIPFGGSGSEVEQCQVLGLDWICSELEPKYCEIIEDRIKNAKGEVGLFAQPTQGSLF